MVVDERRAIAHLLRRAGFGATPEDLDQYEALGLDGTLDRLLNPDSVDEPDHDTAFAALGIDASSPAGAQSRWLHRMLNTNRPLVEKMAFFWHGHFATSIEKVKSGTLMWRQNELFRQQGLGRFEDLALAVSKDPAMLIWLDNAKSKAEAPNENYGREFLELFTLGPGNYSEDDVKASAAAFTGWSLQFTDESRDDGPGTATKGTKAETAATDAAAKLDKKARRRTRDAEFVFRDTFHDGGEKTFLGETGPLDGTDIVRIATSQPESASFITRKLFAFFVWDAPSDDEIAPHVATYLDSGGEIRVVLQGMFASDAFRSERAHRVKMRSPIEYLVAIGRALGYTSFEAGTVQKAARRGVPASLAAMGQVLFAPPNVGGWPSGLGWIGPSGMLERCNLSLELLGGIDESGDGKHDARVAKARMPDWLLQPAATPAEFVALVVARLLDGDPLDGDQQTLIDYLGDDSLDPADPIGQAKRAGVARLVLAMATYQLA